MTTEGALFFYLAILCAAVWGVVAWITGNHYGYVATGVYMAFALAMFLTDEQPPETGK